MATSPTPPRETPPPAARPKNRLWLWVALAFLAGLVLFAIAMRHSGNSDFYRAGDVPPSTAEPGYAPLPAPMAGGNGSGLGPLEPTTPHVNRFVPYYPRFRENGRTAF